MTDAEHVVVVGAGLAAQATIDHLRRENYAGRITLVGDEALAPYDRPPLSKELLWAPEDPQPRPLAITPLDQQQVQYLAMTRAAHLDPDHQCVKLDSGEALSYDHLVIATGASARHLDPDPHHAAAPPARATDDTRGDRGVPRNGVRPQEDGKPCAPSAAGPSGPSTGT